MVEISDREKHRLVPAACRAARALLAWTQEDLAHASGVCRSTVREFEKGHHELQRASEDAISEALKAQGIQFINGPQDIVGVQMHLHA
jgi:transcriptional regulator with XRE-family HTH domain